jgi:dolichol kinase
VAFILFLYRVSKSVKPKELLPLFGFILIGVVLSTVESANILFFLSIIVVFDLIAYTYGSYKGMLMILVGGAYLLMAYLIIPANLMAQAALIGMLSEVMGFKKSRNYAEDKRKETSRDLVQVGVGALIMLMFYYVQLYQAEISLIMLIMLGYLLANYAIINKSNSLAKFLRGLERRYTKFGHGASWLALGTLLAISFVSNTNYLITIFASLFIGDAVATIIGVRLQEPRLFYNKKKTVFGSIAYFIVVSAISYLLVKNLAFLIAAIAALIESLPIKVDDNFSVPFVLTLLLHS